MVVALASCRSTHDRYLDPEAERRSEARLLLEAAEQTRRQALAAFRVTPRDAGPTYFFFESGGEGDQKTSLGRLRAPEDLDTARIDDLRPEGSFDAVHPDPGVFRLIDSLRQEDYFGIEGWRLGPNNVTIRVDLGPAWQFEFGYGRHVKGTIRSYAGFDDPTLEVVQKGRALSGMNSLGFSFTRSVR
ncbi:MAG: hypothetical protein CMJ83_17040 [Planctomycetes bacterium]|nr:hypothetical protein [Planctomycetota bacterium]